MHTIFEGFSVFGVQIQLWTLLAQNRLLPPWARIASRLRAHPTGLALLTSEQTFQEQAQHSSQHALA